MIQYHADQAGGGVDQQPVLAVPDARTRRAPKRDAGMGPEPCLADRDENRPPVLGHGIRRPARCGEQRRRLGEHLVCPATGPVHQRGGIRAAHIDHRAHPRHRARSSAHQAQPASCAAPAPPGPCARECGPGPRRGAAMPPRDRRGRRTRSNPRPCRGCLRSALSASTKGAAENASKAVVPSARLSQARRRRTGVVTRNGLNPFAPVPPASSSSAGWPISVAADQPSAGSGMTNAKRPQASVS